MTTSQGIASLLANYQGEDGFTLISGKEEVEFPSNWERVLRSPREEWVHRALDLWAPFTSYLPRFTAVVKESITDVAFVNYDNSVRIIYCFETGGRGWLYEGGLPGRGELTPSRERVFDKAPRALRDFYDVLHDGFVFLPSRTVGPLSRDMMFCLADEEWG